MAINSRAQLKEWFLPSWKLIQDRVESIFDSFVHKNDTISDSAGSYEINSALQDEDLSVTIEHNLGKLKLLPYLEDNNGNIQYGVSIQNLYELGVCNKTIIFFSETIIGTWKLNIL